MLPIKIENGVASLVVNRQRKLTPRQLATLKRTETIRGETARDQYLSNLLGFTKNRVNIYRVKDVYGSDKLAAKPNGSILEHFKALLQCDEDTNHRPSQRHIGQWVGVEIECYIPCEMECTEDCDHDNDEIHCEPYPSQKQAYKQLRERIVTAGITRASVKDDGSLQDNEGIGVEVTLLFNTADGFEPLNKLCRVLNDAKCYVNKTCGLHVHLDARHLKPKGVKLIGRRLSRALPILKWIVDPSRHTNNYCKLSTSRFTRNRNDRYHAINLVSYFEFKTIEIRLHGGSTNARKIRHWIELVKFLASSKIPKSFNSFQDLIDLGTPEHLIEYADKRISKLNPSAWNELIPGAFSAWPRIDGAA